METIAQRIIAVVEAKGMSKSDFARKINLTPAYISKLDKSPESVPSDRTILDICREFNVNENWLRTGEGEMFAPMTRSESIAKFAGELMKEEEDSFRRQLIEVLSQLSTDEWEVLEGIAKKLAKKD